MVARGSLSDNWFISGQNNLSEKSSAKSRYIRFPSLSSFVGSSVIGSNISVNKSKQDHELFGFRKLARAYFWPTNTAKNDSNEDSFTEKSNCKDYDPEKSHSMGGTVILFGKRPLKTNDKTMRYMLPRKRKYDSYHFTSQAEQERNVSEKLSMPTVIDASTRKLVTEPKFTENYEEKPGIYASPETNKRMESQISDCGMNDSLGISGKRVIHLHKMPTNTGLHSILSQVYGGPLEKVSVLKNEDSTSSVKCIQLHFATHDGARKFIEYGRTNLFEVNGQHINVEWAPQNINVNSNANFECIKAFVDPKKNEAREVRGARRCVILKRNSANDTALGSRRNLSSSKQFLHPLDVKELRKDFERFGEIVEITPMISRKLCISIHYYDVRSAISVIENYNQTNTYFNRKYHGDWTLAYGRDVTDRPCFTG